MATGEAEWAGHAGGSLDVRGRLFEATCLAATAFGLVSVLVLLVFVALDAFRPLSADSGWFAVYGLTLVLPLAALAVAFYRREAPAGEVAYVTTGLPVVGLLLAGALQVLFLELVTVLEWFALVTALAVAVALVLAHATLRPRALVERLAVVVLAPVVTVLGVPPDELIPVLDWVAASLGLQWRLSIRVLSLREQVLAVPVVPVDWVLVVLTVSLPVAAAAGWFVGRRRASRRDGTLLGGGLVAGTLAAPALVATGSLDPVTWVLVWTFVATPVAVYVEGVLRREEGVAGVAFPVVALLGVATGAFLTGALGLSGPDPWLDWGFLTSAHSRTPTDAGIYPVLVGSVMMLIVIVVTTFPVGVGAAVYLEEYAPSQGWWGRVVTLIEINIGNLAGVPSVVYGLLGLALFIRIMSWPQGSVVVGGMAVGLLILPIVIISAQEAIRSVPDSYREASYGMGATRWQTVKRVVLPESLPGILTGTILALGRAIGETAPLLMIGAPASIRRSPNGFFDLFSAMPRQIFSWSSELDPQFRHGVLAAGVVTLVAVLLVMNATAIIIRNKYQRQS